MSQVFINSNSEFYKTLCLYRNYIGYKKPYSYNQWMRLPDNQKAAALYCQFYDQITLAWYKVYTKWSLESEGVSYLVRHLVKNVDKIKNDKKRFKPQYMYKVAWNCLYCVCIDPSKNKDRYYQETSENFYDGETERSWFDCIGEDVDFEVASGESLIRTIFSEVNESCEIFIKYILGEINQRRAFLDWKKLGLVDGNSLDKELVSTTVDLMCKKYTDAFKKILNNY